MATKSPRKRSPAKKKAPAQPVALQFYRTHCPITNELIRFIPAGKMWMATTSIWTSRPFDTKKEAQHAFSYNAGLPPLMDSPVVGAGIKTNIGPLDSPLEITGPSI